MKDVGTHISFSTQTFTPYKTGDKTPFNYFCETQSRGILRHITPAVCKYAKEKDFSESQHNCLCVLTLLLG